MKSAFIGCTNFLFILLFLGLNANYLRAQTPKLLFDPTQVSTLAGSSQGNLNGTGSAAKFFYPTGIACDVSGNIYVADYTNHLIRKITPSGVVTTFAGSGTQGLINGTGTSASFKFPQSVAVDPSGNVFVADRENNAIRKITPAGLVSTFAGNGTSGFVNGDGINARFNYPSGVATDKNGNVYVADQYNHAVRKITPLGFVTTLAGSGAPGFKNDTNSSALFNLPSGLSVDTFGNIYVGDYNNMRIRKVTPTGTVTTLSGNSIQGYRDTVGAYSLFNNPFGVYVDEEQNVFVADKGNRRIRKISPNGLTIALAGTGDYGANDGLGPLAQFASPSGITRDGSGNYYVIDSDNNRIRKLNTPILDTFKTSIGSPSYCQSFNISGRNLTNAVAVTVPSGYQISLDTLIGFVSSLSITPVSGEIAKRIYIRLASPVVGGVYAGNITLASPGASSKVLSVYASLPCNPIVLGPSSLYFGALSTFYNQQLTQTGLTSPTWAISTGSLPPGLSLNTTIGQISGTPNFGGTFNFTLTASQGTCSASRAYSIKIVSTPTADFYYPANYCADRNIAFRDTSFFATSYLWNFGDGVTSTLKNPVHTFAKDTTYFVSLTVNGVNTITKPVDVYTTPVINAISVYHDCSNYYTFSGAPIGDTYSYRWVFGPNSYGVDTLSIISHRTFSATASTSVTLMVYSGGRCPASKSTTLIPKTAATALTARITVSAPSGNLCSTTRTITNNSSAGFTSTKYSVDGGPFLPLTVGSITLNNITAGSHYFRLAANDGACYDTTFNYYTISVPTVQFTATPTTCNQTVAFTNQTTTTDNGPIQYLWSFGTPVLGTSTTKEPFFSFGTPGNNNATLTATAASGCAVQLTKSFTVGSGTGGINVNFTFGNTTSTCKNRYLFTNTTPGAAGYTNQWDFGDGTTSNKISPTKAYADSGTFYVTLLVLNGNCPSMVTKTVNISGVQGPMANFTINKSTQTTAENNFIFLNTSKYLGKGFNNKYYWKFSDGSMDTVNNSVYNKAFPSAGFYQVTLIAKSSEGCLDTAEQTVEVKQVPVANFGFYGINCLNRTVNFADSSILATSYLWDFGDGSTSILQNPSHTFARDSIYQVTLTINGNVTKTLAVKVANNPNSGFTYTANNCNNRFYFQANQTGYGITHRWSFSKGVANDTMDANPILTFSAAQTAQAVLRVTSAGLCTSTSAPVNVTSSLGARAAVLITSSDYCNQTRYISNSSVNASNTYYSIDDSTFATLPSTITLSNVAIGMHKLVVVAKNVVCSDTLVTYFNVSDMTGTFNAFPSKCDKSVDFISGMQTSDGSAIRYLWNFNGTDTSSLANPNYTFLTTGSKTITMTATAQSGCKKIISKIVNIVIPSKPVSTFTFYEVTGSLCRTGIQFTATSTNGAVSYIWNYGDGSNSAQSTNKTNFHAFNQVGAYTVMLTSFNADGCASNSLPQSVTVSSIGKQSPVAGFSVNDTDQCITTNNFNFINSSVLNSAGFIVSYAWTFGDGSFDSVNTSSYGKRYSAIGTYNVKLKVVSNQGCPDSITHKVYVLPDNLCIPQGLQGDLLGLDQSMVLFPNPNNGKFTLKFGSTQMGNLEIITYDITGRELNKQTLDMDGLSEFDLDQQELLTGRYFMVIRNQKGEVARRSFSVIK